MPLDQRSGGVGLRSAAGGGGGGMLRWAFAGEWMGMSELGSLGGERTRGCCSGVLAKKE